MRSDGKAFATSSKNGGSATDPHQHYKRVPLVTEHEQSHLKYLQPVEITNSSLHYLSHISTKTLPATSYESLPPTGEDQIIKLDIPVYAKKLQRQTRMLVMPPEDPL